MTSLSLFYSFSIVDRFKETVIEERRHSAEEFLQIASQQLHLYSSAPFYSFMKVSYHIYISYNNYIIIIRELLLLKYYQLVNLLLHLFRNL